jgi:hypothetical protein
MFGLLHIMSPSMTISRYGADTRSLLDKMNRV